MSAFTEAIEHSLDGLEHASTGLAPQCPDCQSDYGMSPRMFYTAVISDTVFDEGSFSSDFCDCCGSSLGGSRYAAHAFDKSGRLYHLEICVDCLMYIANGDEPDDWPSA